MCWRIIRKATAVSTVPPDLEITLRVTSREADAGRSVGRSANSAAVASASMLLPSK
ncbi:hypothetical protein D3C86_2086900 [compost metagenome]